MSESNIRHRVLLEPRGFIRVIEFILAIVVFATTGGYSGQGDGSVKCPSDAPRTFSVPISYPFVLDNTVVQVPACMSNGSDSNVPVNVTLNGDYSPTAQWFMFVAVMAFLICLGSVIFYVGFELNVRRTHEKIVTVTDLVVTGVWTFLWLTAASAWAWGLNEVKTYGSVDFVLKESKVCTGVKTVCPAPQEADFGALNASVAFAFLSMIVWGFNVWFVYKETPYHDDQVNLTPNEAMPSQQVPGNQN